jgi:hypothetical protein
MTKKTLVQPVPKTPMPESNELHVGADGAGQPASNASQPLAKPRERIKAHIDQATILEKGSNALPVSDYPLKKGPVAANTIDLKERAQRGVKRD